MKLTFLFSFSLHLVFLIVAGTLSRIPTFETSDNFALSQVSILNMPTYNAMISEPPANIALKTVPLFQEVLKDHQDINGLKVQKGRYSYEYITGSIKLPNPVDLNSHAPSFDTSFVSQEKKVFDNQRSFMTVGNSYEEVPSSLKYFVASDKEKVNLFTGSPFLIKSLMARDLDKEGPVLFQGNIRFKLINHTQDYSYNKFSKMIEDEILFNKVNYSSPKNHIVPPIQFFQNKPPLVQQKTKDMDLKVGLAEVFATPATSSKPILSENLNHKVADKKKFNQVSKKSSNEVSLEESKVSRNELKVWGSSIQNKIYANLTYPYLALIKKIGGKVTIHLKITKEGRLAKLKILKSSGFSILDEEALRATKTISAFPSAPSSLIRPVYSFSLPIKFEL